MLLLLAMTVLVCLVVAKAADALGVLDRRAITPLRVVFGALCLVAPAAVTAGFTLVVHV